jgi:hypothetical protein
MDGCFKLAKYESLDSIHDASSTIAIPESEIGMAF